MNEEKRRTNELLKEAEKKALEAETKAEELAIKQEGVDELMATLKQGPRTKQVSNMMYRVTMVASDNILYTFFQFHNVTQLLFNFCQIFKQNRSDSATTKW